MTPPEHAELRLKEIISRLARHEVDFVLIGGLAGMAHGSAYPTYDVVIAYSRRRENLERLATALRELGATLRGASVGLPFQLDAKTLKTARTSPSRRRTARWTSLATLSARRRTPNSATPARMCRSRA